MADHSVTVDATPPSAPAWWTPWCSDCGWTGTNWPWGQRLQAELEGSIHEAEQRQRKAADAN